MRLFLAVFIVLFFQSCASQYVRIDNKINYLIEYRGENGLDNWQRPFDTVYTKLGDCEDFALLKYRLFLDAGANEQDLFFLVVRIKKSDTLHALIEYDGIYYDSYMKNRDRYNKDFQIIDRFNSFSDTDSTYYKKFMRALNNG